MEARTLNNPPPAGTHDDAICCVLAIELSKKSWIVAVNTPLAKRSELPEMAGGFGHDRTHDTSPLSKLFNRSRPAGMALTTFGPCYHDIDGSDRMAATKEGGVRARICMAMWFSIGAIEVALAQSGPARIENPKVQGKDVDHCADIDGSNDCSARGQSKAATQVCIAYGYADQVDSHWHASSGVATHYISQYDMHAGEVPGRWESRRSDGPFDWVACKK